MVWSFQLKQQRRVYLTIIVIKRVDWRKQSLLSFCALEAIYLSIVNRLIYLLLELNEHDQPLMFNRHVLVEGEFNQSDRSFVVCDSVCYLYVHFICSRFIFLVNTSSYWCGLNRTRDHFKVDVST